MINLINLLNNISYIKKNGLVNVGAGTTYVSKENEKYFIPLNPPLVKNKLNFGHIDWRVKNE